MYVRYTLVPFTWLSKHSDLYTERTHSKKDGCERTSLSVRIAGCNEFDVFSDGGAFHPLVTHDLFDQSNSISCVGLVKEQYCVKSHLLICTSFFLDSFNKFYDGVFCGTTMHLVDEQQLECVQITLVNRMIMVQLNRPYCT